MSLLPAPTRSLIGSLTPMPTPADPDPGLLALWRAHLPARQTAPVGPSDCTAAGTAAGTADRAATSERETLRALGLAAGMPEPDSFDLDGTGDYEDWTEMACRLRAILASGAGAEDTRLWLSWGRVTDHLARLVASTEQTPGHATEHAADPVALLGPADLTVADSLHLPVAHYGPLAESSPLRDAHGSWMRAADSYYLHPAFAEVAGRRSVLAGIHADDEPLPYGADLAVLMAAWARDGVRRVFVKARKAKRGVWTIPACEDTDANRAAIAETMDWDVVYFAGAPEALIAQPHIDMRHEYRVFIVDGRPVTGAGCIEFHTPLDAPGGLLSPEQAMADPFAPFTEEVRGTGEVTDDTPASRHLVAAAVRAAHEAAYAFGNTFGRGYVIDVAWSPAGPGRSAGEWVVIEANALDNAGLYASRPELVTSALVRPRRA